MNRCAVFIDGGYAKKVFEGFGYPKISYMKLSQFFAKDEERLRTYYYDCPPFVPHDPNEHERQLQRNFDRFRFALEREPRFDVKLGKLVKRPQPDGTFKFEQKMTDILLTVDLVQLSASHQIQRAVILAHDRDFVPAIEVAKPEGTVVELYYGSPKPHEDLMFACDECIPITQEIIDKIKI